MISPVQQSMPALVGRSAAKKVGRIAHGTLPLFIDQSVLDSIVEFSASNTKQEIGGFLVGNFCQDFKPFLYVRHFLPASDTSSRFASLTFTHNTWEKMNTQIERSFPDHRVIGWHHTHPSMGVFLSNHDRFIQRHFFDQTWQIAMVVDPCQQQLGIFQWNNNQLINNGFLIVPEKKTFINRKTERNRRFEYDGK